MSLKFNAIRTEFETHKRIALNESQTGVDRLLAVMRCLRHPEQGCPWDLKQTAQSLIPYTIEEAYEVAAAITEADPRAIQGELGDLLFQVVFYAQLAEEQQEFNFDGIAEVTANKLIRRHPHVFAGLQVQSDEEIKENWEAIKQQERKERNQQASVFTDVPSNLPAVLRAMKIQKRCANVGFDWDSALPVVAKVEEEIAEICEVLSAVPANTQPDPLQYAQITEEVGDLLFAVVNLARHLQVNPESALQQANQKFMRRFEYVEQAVHREEGDFSRYSLTQLEKFWQEAKEATKSD